MTPEQVDRLINLVVTIGGKAATEGFAIAMRRVAYLGTMNLIWAAFVTVLECIGLYFARLCWHKHIEHKDDRCYDGGWSAGAWTLAIVMAMVWLMTVPAMTQGRLDRLINPEWHAVQMLLELL